VAPAPAVLGAGAARPRSPAPVDEARRDRYQALYQAAEAAEAEGKWEEAIEHWRQTLNYADDRMAVTARLETLQRALAFEQLLGSVVALAAAGEWSKAEAALTSAAAMRPDDQRVEQARARLPRRLVEAWLEGSHARLGDFPPAGKARETLLRRLILTRARFGDLGGAVRWLQDESADLERRVRGLAQAVCAALQGGQGTDVRAYLDRAAGLAAGLEDPGARGRAQLELGRAYTVLGDGTAAAQVLEQAAVALRAVRPPSSVAIDTQAAPTRPRPRPTGMMNVHSARYGLAAPEFEAPGPLSALGAVAEAQAEAGQPEVALRTADQIQDPWTRAQTLASIAQVLARTGRAVEAEHLVDCITYGLPRARALRAVALANIAGGDLEAGEQLLPELTSPEEHAPTQAELAAARHKLNQGTRAQVHAKAALQDALEIKSAPGRVATVLACAEPYLALSAADQAKPFLTAAARAVDGLDDARERILGILALAPVRARAAAIAGARVSAPATGATQRDAGGDARAPGPMSQDVLSAVRRALTSLAGVQEAVAREECLEGLGQMIAAGRNADLAAELLTLCRNQRERAWAYCGLAAGMVQALRG
jgi:tetratricopeptide (TPR) repeat protein